MLKKFKQFITEEKIATKRVFCDLDGVLVDFKRGFKRLKSNPDHLTPNEYDKKHGKNSIWKLIDDRKNMEEANKLNFMALLKDYRKMSEDIMSAKKNNTMLTWVKDDKIESLQDLEKDFHEIMTYHVKLIEFFSSNVELEKAFYCGI
jgi:hypothetical protein